MSIGDFFTFSAYVIFLFSKARSIISNILAFQMVFAAMDRLKEIFNPPFERPCILASSQSKMPLTLSGNIEFKNVSYSYGTTGNEILKDISCSIQPDEITLLTGRSGSGKTTFINLLIKFLTPTKGKILIDNIDIQDIHTEHIRRQIGFVSQNIFLFNDTIENNILYSKPSASKKEVREAAEKAQIHQEILMMPKGYDSMVGERGIFLSAGQMQRISIARAFLKDPKILLMDEPSSALDSTTERELFQSLKEIMLNRTTIIITHKKNVESNASKILYLDRGVLIQKNITKDRR